jgi:hypothetical protein
MTETVFPFPSDGCKANHAVVGLEYDALLWLKKWKWFPPYFYVDLLCLSSAGNKFLNSLSLMSLFEKF